MGLVDVGRGATKMIFSSSVGDFPLNHNKQKCKNVSQQQACGLDSKRNPHGWLSSGFPLLQKDTPTGFLGRPPSLPSWTEIFVAPTIGPKDGLVGPRPPRGPTHPARAARSPAWAPSHRPPIRSPWLASPTYRGQGPLKEGEPLQKKPGNPLGALTGPISRY